MTRRPPRPRVGEWFLRVDVSVDYMRRDNFSRTLVVALYKLKHRPPENVEAVHGKDYSGFVFRLNYRVPFYVERWR